MTARELVITQDVRMSTPVVIHFSLINILGLLVISESDSLHEDVREGRIEDRRDGDKDDSTPSPTNGNSMHYHEAVLKAELLQY